MNSNEAAFPHNDVPFQANWRDNLHGIANGLPWMMENLKEPRTYFGTFIHLPTGQLVGWHFHRQTGLRYQWHRPNSSPNRAPQLVVFVVTANTIKFFEDINRTNEDDATVYRPFVNKLSDGRGVVWKPTAQWVRIHTNYLDEISSTDYSLRSQITNLLSERLLVSESEGVSRRFLTNIMSNYLAPEVDLRTSMAPVRLDELEPIWDEFVFRLKAYDTAVASDNPELQQLIQKKLGGSVLKFNAYFGSQFTHVLDLAPTLDTDTRILTNPKIVEILKAMFGQ